MVDSERLDADKSSKKENEQDVVLDDAVDNVLAVDALDEKEWMEDASSERVGVDRGCCRCC